MTNGQDRVQCFLTEVLCKNGVSSSRVRKIVAEFGSLKAFTSASSDQMKALLSTNGILSDKVQKELKTISEIQLKIDPDKDLNENWIKFTNRDTIHKIKKNIEKITLDTISINPFLTRMLHFNTPEEMLRFNIYQVISRSFVTSMGTALEYMVADCGGDSSRRGTRKEWYDVVKNDGKKKYWLQIKSGPNNIDKDQMEAYNKKFKKTAEEPNHYPKLGIVYGKPGNDYISTKIARKHLDGYESKMLIGRDLWKFMSGEDRYHEKVLRWISEAAEGELREKSIDYMVQEKIREIKSEFERKYGESIDEYIKDSI